MGNKLIIANHSLNSTIVSLINHKNTPHTPHVDKRKKNRVIYEVLILITTGTQNRGNSALSNSMPKEMTDPHILDDICEKSIGG